MSKKSVLVVEDEPKLRDVLASKLSLEGYEILQAKNGHEGLTQALANHPSLIVLDLVMPKSDGIDMLHSLRQDEWGKDVRVIILTNDSDEDRLSRALSEGVYEYLIKSDTSLDLLCEKIASGS